MKPTFKWTKKGFYFSELNFLLNIKSRLFVIFVRTLFTYEIWWIILLNQAEKWILIIEKVTVKFIINIKLETLVFFATNFLIFHNFYIICSKLCQSNFQMNL